MPRTFRLRLIDASPKPWTGKRGWMFRFIDPNDEIFVWCPQYGPTRTGMTEEAEYVVRCTIAGIVRISGIRCAHLSFFKILEKLPSKYDDVLKSHIDRLIHEGAADWGLSLTEVEVRLRQSKLELHTATQADAERAQKKYQSLKAHLEQAKADEANQRKIELYKKLRDASRAAILAGDFDESTRLLDLLGDEKSVQADRRWHAKQKAKQEQQKAREVELRRWDEEDLRKADILRVEVRRRLSAEQRRCEQTVQQRRNRKQQIEHAFAEQQKRQDDANKRFLAASLELTEERSRIAAMEAVAAAEEQRQAAELYRRNQYRPVDWQRGELPVVYDIELPHSWSPEQRDRSRQLIEVPSPMEIMGDQDWPGEELRWPREVEQLLEGIGFYRSRGARIDQAQQSILSQLRLRFGGYVTSRELAQVLNLKHTTIRKRIGELRLQGYPIIADHKGYTMAY